MFWVKQQCCVALQGIEKVGEDKDGMKNCWWIRIKKR